MNSAQAVRSTRERKNKQNTRSHTGPASQARGADGALPNSLHKLLFLSFKIDFPSYVILKWFTSNT